MGEPLNVTNKLGHPQDYFKRSEIESAVEWLNEELHKCSDRPQYNKAWVHELINQAFPDLQDITKGGN